MERNRYKKIRIFSGILLLFGVFAACGVFYLIQAGEDAYETIVAKLALEFPHDESIIIRIVQGNKEDNDTVITRKWQDKKAKLRKKYQYDAYDFYGVRLLLAAIIFLSAVFVLTCGVLFLAEAAVGRKEWKEWRRELQDIKEALISLRTGRYSIAEPESCASGYTWMLWEELKELGRSLEKREEGFWEEEQNTKALITNISHQLKTPLASLKINYEMADYDALEKEEKQEFLARGKEDIERLEEMLNELLRLSQLENHMIRLNPQRGNIKDAVISAVNVVIMKACKKRIDISLTMHGEDCCVFDKRWTTEAILNILDNAVKYSGAGSNIRIRISNTVHYVLTEIEDEGMGIPKDEYYKIFQRFYRGAKAVRMETEGAGVGLYLARSVVEKQGGAIYLKSKEGRGSLFQILLPRK